MSAIPTAKRINSRTKILDAAAQIIREVGASRLTLDAVAQRAGISKGGLLYNFPSKDALLQGMIQRIVDEVAIRKDHLRTTLKSGPNLEARVITTVLLEMREPEAEDLALGILSAFGENRELLSPVRHIIDEAYTQLLADAENPKAALLAWLAVEGLRGLEMHGLSPLSEADRKDFASTIKELLEQPTALVLPGTSSRN
ncbi:TetR/AcrR family transcriptional regulator [Methylocella sp. CPCC 101449]|jgi:AcrR family transcriptional regulator|uniref:TetR/AcrR family transcriptional regulator n=1 Tax=Methylocella sp. CPCC 101449 TaxID=2987531 RepID=UPI00288FD282|nr:TetR/AcrR family transcriptional regulator [Methylocella sp. CPCC 101449]MDT2022926.1 TetR/AcrR family transcriptional regulator [Methylocella sp. CPCC 101449]HEV2570429.1 TetR/AcrR family transcriptional regulator [Beijerinckiaceae bacterium]